MALSVAAANREAVDRLCRARPMWTAMSTAREALGLSGRALLHAGPPITWDRMCDPMRGAVLCAAQYEGWAPEPVEAERLAASGGIGFAPCHSRGAVGPMAGIISPRMPVIVVEDRVNGTRACATMGTGPGPQIRFGAHGPEALARLAWNHEVMAPALQAVLEREGPLDLTALMAQALTMGDEMHMRNAASTSLLARWLAGPLAGAVKDPTQLERILRFLTRDNDQHFLTWGMCAAKAAARAIEGLEGSTIVSAMARNGVEFGIRVAGLGDRWFTGPASVVAGAYFPGFGAADANRDIGDSAIMEPWGLGGMAMVASPAVIGIVGAKSFQAALATTRSMQEIAAGANPAFSIAAVNGAGAPTGIDVRRVVESGIVPSINTAIAHRDRTVARIIGAGIATPPLEPFTAALLAFDGAYR
jgi:hypothetical protein